jgi:hypothetical protein
MLARASDEASKKLHYNFADLTGIIFGIKTAAEDKHWLSGRLIRVANLAHPSMMAAALRQ